MEVAAAKHNNEKSNFLIAQTRAIIRNDESKIAWIAKEIGYSRVTLSRYLAGKYDSNPSGIETRLEAYLASQGINDLKLPSSDIERKCGHSPRFYESRDAKAILGVCQSCQEYREMGIVVGRSGYGKTYTLKEYAKLSRVAYIECDVTMSPRDLLKELERALGIPPRSGTNHDRANSIVDFLMVNPGYLLIVDEADKLMSKYTCSKMDILRSVFDRCSGKLSPDMVGKRIRETRLVAGFNQKKFAETLGISQSHISAIEKGRETPSDTLLMLIGCKYGVDYVWLKWGSMPKYTPEFAEQFYTFCDLINARDALWDIVSALDDMLFQKFHIVKKRQ